MIGDDLLEPGRQADVGGAVPGSAVRRAARVLQGRRRAARASGASPTPARRCWRAWPTRASAASSWPRCRRSSTPRTATCSTCWPTWPLPQQPRTRGGPRRRSAAATAASIHRQAAGLCRLRAGAVRQQGVDELDQEKLSPLLRLRYRALNDAFEELGDQTRCATCSWDFSGICTRDSRHRP